jgi:hypothetical protein
MTPPLEHALRAWMRRIGATLDAPLEGVPPLRQPQAIEPIAPALLARTFPSPKARHEMQALYQRCLKHFRQRVQRGAAEDDGALAAAYFTLANLAVVQGLQPDEHDLARVERQMRPRLAAAWHRAPLRDRQSAFEQFALLGVLVAESKVEAERQGAAALANLRQAARAYLAHGFGLDAERLRLGEEGLLVERAVA